MAGSKAVARVARLDLGAVSDFPVVGAVDQLVEACREHYLGAMIIAEYQTRVAH